MSSEVEISRLRQFAVLGLEDPLCCLIYLKATKNVELSQSIEVEIDLSPLIAEDYFLITRKEIVKALKQLVKAEVVEILHSSNWKHRKLLVHPIQKVLQEKNKK